MTSTIITGSQNEDEGLINIEAVSQTPETRIYLATRRSKIARLKLALAKPAQ
jgi:hypothetical protein